MSGGYLDDVFLHQSVHSCPSRKSLIQILELCIKNVRLEKIRGNIYAGSRWRLCVFPYILRNDIMNDNARAAVIISADRDVSQTPSMPRKAGRTARETSGKAIVCPKDTVKVIQPVYSLR